MAVTSFIPELWSGALLAHLDKSHVVANLVNRNYEGEIRQYGDKVRINQLQDIRIENYSKGKIAEPSELTTNCLTLEINKRKYFNFFLEDVDAAQVRNSGALMDEAMQRVAYSLADAIEKDILTEIQGDGNNTKQTAGATLSAENIFKEILEMKTTLDKQNVPTAGRNLIVSPEVHAFLIDSGKFTGTGGAMAEEITRNGFVGKVLGFDVFMSNNLADLPKGKCAIAFNKECVTFAEQVSEMEAYRPELRFADAVKGLTVYGTKVTLPKCIVCLDDVEAP